MITTNKESQFFSDLELSRRLERAEAHSNAKFVEARARVYPESGAQWIEVAGAYAMYDGISSPITQTFGLGLFETVTSAELEKIEKFFKERGAPVFHEVSPLAGLELVALLNERGYQPMEFSSVMYRPIRGDIDSALPRNEKNRVRAITENEGELWAQTTVKGWSHLPELSEYLQELGPISTQREDAVSFLAELDGQPVAAAALSLSGGVALLAGACTIPEARKQGAQLALLDYRLRYAAEQGCDLAMMCAQPGSASQRNAERHGFRIAYTRLKWRLA
ncbi:GNAT family N-acetyltransferase [candidate division KSB1 bacterium]|nr:GNAT family N-acetyltransferase [candidate division KSB1 bacterium]